MASERERIDGFVKDARQGGASDDEIYSNLVASKNLPRLQGFLADSKKGGATDNDIASHLGLSIQQPRNLGTLEPMTISASENAKRTGFVPKDIHDAEKEYAKEKGKTTTWDSASLGFVEPLGATLWQKGLQLKDAVTGGNSSEKFTKDFDYVRKLHERQRDQNDQGFDWWRLGGNIAATAPLGAAGRGFQGAKILSKTGAKVLGQNAAVGTGIGAVSFAKDGEERIVNALLGAGGGAAGSAIGEKVGQGVRAVARRQSSPSISSADAEAKINAVFRTIDDGDTEIRLQDFAPDAQLNIVNQVKKMMEKGQSPDAQTLARMGVFTDIKLRGTDLKPTLKQATGEPNLWTRESELAKLKGAEDLNTKYAEDHTNLRGLLDDLSQKTGGNYLDEYGTGEAVLKSLRTQDQSRQRYISAMYDHAKSLQGNDLALDAGRFANNMKQALDEDLVDITLIPAPLLKRTQDFIDGKVPFNLAQKEVLVKQINKRLQGADNQTRYALQSFRNSLEKEVDDSLDQFGSTIKNQDAKTAWDDARKAAAGRFSLIDRTPAIQKALDDAEPDKAFDQLIWRGKVREVESLAHEIKNDQYALNNVRQAIIKRIAEKSIGISGAFSPKEMFSALKTIGDRKLELFFNEDELKYLKNIGLASKFLISHPVGSNVNHSNSSSAAANAIMQYFSKYLSPLAQVAVVKPAVNLKRSFQANAQLNAGAKALSKTAKNDPPPTPPNDDDIVNRLIRAGLISGGANFATQ